MTTATPTLTAIDVRGIVLRERHPLIPSTCRGPAAGAAMPLDGQCCASCGGA